MLALFKNSCLLSADARGLHVRQQLNKYGMHLDLRVGVMKRGQQYTLLTRQQSMQIAMTLL